MPKPLVWVRDHRAPTATGASLLALAFLFAASTLPRQAAFAFAAAGGLALFVRSVVRVDGGRERARLWWTFLGVPLLPFGSIPLADVRAVRVDLRSGPKRTRFDVGLMGERAHVVWRGNDLLRARRFAERLASGLSLPLHDGSTGRFRTRDPDELDLSLGERLRLAGPPPAPPVLPQGSPLRLREGAETIIRFPGQPVSPLLVAFWLAAPAFFVVLFWLLSTPRTAVVVLPIPVFLLVVFGWAAAGALRPKLVVVGPAWVEVRRLGWRRRIPFAELEEVVYAGDGLHLLSDRAQLFVPHGWLEDGVGRSRFDPRGAAQLVAQVVERAAYQHAAAEPGAAAPGPRLAAEASPHWAAADRVAVPTPDRAAPRRRRRRADRSPLQLGAIFLAVGLAGAGVGAHWASTLREFVKRATVTSGTVVELQRVRSQSAHEADVYQPVVRFELPSGKAIVFRDPVGSSPPSYGVGERVEVRYDPLRPGDARVGSLRNLWAWPVLVGGLSAMFALAGLSLLLWYRQEAREVRRLVRGDAPAGRGLDSVDRSGSRPRG